MINRKQRTENREQIVKKKKGVFFLIFLSSALCLLSSFCFAEQIHAGQNELAVARGCLLYDSGKLKEAMQEFQMVLLNDPLNEAAKIYINKIWTRRYDGGISSWELNEEMTGRKNARASNKKIEVTDQYKYASGGEDKPYERFINTTSFGYNDRRFESSADRSFSPDGFFIAEHMRMDSPSGDWQNTISLDARYHDNGHEDARVRRLTYVLNSPDGVRFIVGDTSTYLSRYTLRGLYYRGVNMSLKSDTNEFKILAGATPHFLTKTSDHPNRDNEYIHPRKVFAARDTYKVRDGYRVGVSFMELRDSERVRVIDSVYNPKLNRVFAVTQDIDAVPDKWRIQAESAYSTSDEDRTDQNILIGDKKLKDAAHYIRSAIEIPRFRLVNSFERIGSDFRSYADLASTNSTWLAAITSDREKIDNYMEYRPFEFDPVYLDLNLSRVRSNLDKDADIEMNQQLNYGGAVRFVPEELSMLPQGAIRIKYLDTLGVPGSQYASNDVSDRDLIFELAKKIYGVDLNTSYTNRKTLDNILTYGTYTNIYDIRAAKELTDMVMLSADYSHSNSYKDENGSEGTTAKEDFFNINAALRLWAGANLSLGYSYENDEDLTGMLFDTRTNTYSTTFSWPISRYFLKHGSELTLAPYFTYQLADGSTAESKNRYIWTSAVDATYIIAKDHRISLSAYYRNDQHYYEDISTGSSSTQIEDYRFLLTYQKIFQ